MKSKWGKMNIFIASIFMFIYIFSGFYFLYSNSVSHNGMHHHNSPHCTYIMGQDTLCSMNIFDFLNKWKDVYSINISYGVLFLYFIPFISLISLILYLKFYNRILYLKRSFTIPILYETLFSKGILNSKAF